MIEELRRRRRETIAMVDADIVMYQVVTQCIREKNTRHDEWTYEIDLIVAREMFDDRMEDLRRTLYVKDVRLAFSSRTNWRKKIMPEYKAQRTVRKPLGYLRMVEWAMKEYSAARFEGLEADDVLGLTETLALTDDPVDVIMVSEDKDLMGVCGKLYNPRKPDAGVTKTNVEASERFWLTQTLAGDSADGYKGVPGVGAVKATSLLAAIDPWNVRRAWGVVLEQFECASLSEADATRTAIVARILQSEDDLEHVTEGRLPACLR